MPWIVFLLLFFQLGLKAQFSDNFNDGDFTQNPTWSGDVSDWIVVNGMLRSNGPAITPTVIYLSTPSTRTFDCQWEFFANPKLATTSGNFIDVFLISDQENLKGNLNGFFVRIGGTADEVCLYKKQGAVITKIIDGEDGRIASSSNNPTKIKVIRTATGLFSLEVDFSGSGSKYSLQGSVIDATAFNSGFFGVLVNYSASNNLKYYFDDFYVGPIIIDTLPPSLKQLKIISSNSIDLLFSEALDSITSENTGMYKLNKEDGAPVYALRDKLNHSLVHLIFSGSFQSGTSYLLTIDSLKDLAGNSKETTTHAFHYYQVKQLDVIFNELMVDPSPKVGLPEYEYIELYNRTSFPIDLSGWSLKYANSIKKLPEITIEPLDYLVLCSESALPSFGFINKVVSVEGLSSTALVNTGTTLALKDSTGLLVHSVNYDENWYRSTIKKEGGWSLELIDSNNPCGGAFNWRASHAISGGTPGEKNTVSASNKDISAPYLLRVAVLDPFTLKVYYSEGMLAALILNPENYFINNGIGKPLGVGSLSNDFSSVQLSLQRPLEKGTIYKLKLNTAVQDCAGNDSKLDTELFVSLPETVENNDLIINEILFNPKEGGVDFVEIYNRSFKVVDLKGLRLANIDSVFNSLSSVKVIDTTSYLLFPGNYIVLCSDPEAVRQQYLVSSANFIKMTLPSFNNGEGSVALTTSNDEVLDNFFYHEKMHFPLLNTFKGVSLERLNPDRATLDNSNWHSASEGVGFASPGKQNSQFMAHAAGLDVMRIEPEIFSPNNDGYNDVVGIYYQFESPGSVGNVQIFNSKGLLVRSLIKNELLGSNGAFSWDGIDNFGVKCPLGIYIIYLEIFDLSGNVKNYKQICVLGDRI